MEMAKRIESARLLGHHGRAVAGLISRLLCSRDAWAARPHSGLFGSIIVRHICADGELSKGPLVYVVEKLKSGEIAAG